MLSWLHFHLLILFSQYLFFFSFQSRFQASGDHLPVAPPAPAHAQLAAVQAAQYNAKNYDLGSGAEGGFDDGQYDPRYNDPNFSGNQGAHLQAYAQPAPQPQYVPQAQPQPIPQQPQPQYNPTHNYIAQYQSTTQNPHRFQPPGNSYQLNVCFTLLFFFSALLYIIYLI